jgi:CBS domain containing-hemolysin-like protein
MGILILVVLATILVSASCSLFEAILFSARRASVEAEKRDPARTGAATRFIELKSNIALSIASILILNTISHTGGATVAGMYASDELGYALMPLFSILFTVAILAFSEIMPKTLGAVYWRNLWPYIVWPLIAMNYALYPLILVSQGFTNLLTRGRKKPAVTEDEILALVRMGAKEGEISDGESRLVHNIIELEDIPIKNIMTPRTVIFSLDATMTVSEAIEAADQKGFTRIPVCEGDPENIVGYVITHDLFSAKALKTPEAPLRSIIKPIRFVPQTRNSLALLTYSLRQRQHIFVVVDEYGGVAGVITLEDLLETLLGEEIVDETDTVVDLQEKARQKRPQVPTS